MLELPFYRLPELAVRWDCSVDQLIRLGTDCRARICVNLYGGLPVECRIDRQTVTRPRDVPVPDDEPSFLRLATLPAMPVGFYELVMFELQLIAAEGFPQRLGFAYQCDGHRWEACRFSGDMPTITERSLCILREEVERLDREVFAEASTAVVPRPATTAMDEGIEPSDDPIPAGAATATRSRSDPLTVDIDAALTKLPVESHRSAHALLAELKKVAGKPGSCVLEVGPGFVLWQRADGTPRKTDAEALARRLERRLRRADN